jgi:hypothetical protein
MFRIYGLILTIIAFSNLVHAQKTGTVRGIIKNKQTQETIVGATVIVEGTQLGSATDLDGNYRINNVPVGSYNLKASIVGYKPQSKFNVSVTSGNDQLINFELEETGTDLKEFEITFDKNKSASSKISTMTHMASNAAVRLWS